MEGQINLSRDGAVKGTNRNSLPIEQKAIIATHRARKQELCQRSFSQAMEFRTTFGFSFCIVRTRHGQGKQTERYRLLLLRTR